MVCKVNPDFIVMFLEAEVQDVLFVQLERCMCVWSKKTKLTYITLALIKPLASYITADIELNHNFQNTFIF